jgi:hypothetical protein
LLAVRTRDPSAGLVAARVEAAMREQADQVLPALWRWVPIVLPADNVPRCDLEHLPSARNLGSAVIFRGGEGTNATTIWIDAGQPFLRRRQHFDAGHFMIDRGGELTVDAADDVTFEAVSSKGGGQHLGEEREPFDFEQYLTATIAHNCIVLWDSARVSQWYGKRYRPAGGQRCSEETCSDFTTPLAGQLRETGRQLAFGCSAGAAYLALDLASAYDRRTISAYAREFIFVWGRALIVVDRLTLPQSRAMPTWVLNVPSRPQADGHDLVDMARVAGSTNAAGVWRCDGAEWLRWTDRDGGAWLRSLRPSPRILRAVGGPAEKLRITEGPLVNRTYVGGSADGYERLILPAERSGALNAWYRLETPTFLGAPVGQTPHLGRIEIEPRPRRTTPPFVTLLVTDAATATTAPEAEISEDGGQLVIHLRQGDDEATVRLNANAIGGVVTVGTAERPAWPLPNSVVPDAPLAGDSLVPLESPP